MCVLCAFCGRPAFRTTKLHKSPQLSEFGENVYAYAVTACPYRVRPLCPFPEIGYVTLASTVTSALDPNEKLAQIRCADRPPSLPRTSRQTAPRTWLTGPVGADCRAVHRVQDRCLPDPRRGGPHRKRAVADDVSVRRGDDGRHGRPAGNPPRRAGAARRHRARRPPMP